MTVYYTGGCERGHHAMASPRETQSVKPVQSRSRVFAPRPLPASAWVCVQRHFTGSALLGATGGPPRGDYSPPHCLRRTLASLCSPPRSGGAQSLEAVITGVPDLRLKHSVLERGLAVAWLGDFRRLGHLSLLPFVLLTKEHW